MSANPHPRPLGRPRARGFTLIELLVSFTILLLILIAVLTLFERNTRVARTQTHIADLQQAVRVSQHQLVRNIRMAGRGPLPMYQFGPNPKFLPTGVAVEVWNNAAKEDGEDAEIAPGFPDSPAIAENSDVLVIRGVINSSLYQLNPTAASFGFDGTDGFVDVPNISPTGVPQDLEALCDSVRDEDDEVLPTAVVITSTISDESYAVVEAATIDGCDGAANVRIGFTIDGDNGARYLELSPNGAFPPELTTAAFIGVLEEYRYYVREDPVATDLENLTPEADFVRRLSRAHVYPNTNTPFAGAVANLAQDLADNIVDLQVALGVKNYDLFPGVDVPVESDPPDEDDEWLFNFADDNADNVCQWNGVGGAGCTTGNPNILYYVRVTTVGRTDRPDPGWIDPAIGFIEDHNYAESPGPQSPAEINQRRFRRWSLTTTVDLRNLS